MKSRPMSVVVIVGLFRPLVTSTKNDGKGRKPLKLSEWEGFLGLSFNVKVVMINSYLIVTKNFFRKSRLQFRIQSWSAKVFSRYNYATLSKVFMPEEFLMYGILLSIDAAALSCNTAMCTMHSDAKYMAARPR